MKINKILKLFIFLFLLIVLGCRQEYDLSTNQQQKDRAEQFFKNRNEGGKAINSSLTISTIDKLELLNKKNNFLSKLSDKVGLPVWNYTTEGNVKKYNKTTNKGNDEAEMLIIPLKNSSNYLSSLMYVENPDSEAPKIYTVTNDQLETFVYNSNIDKGIRESVLLTFFYFDRTIFKKRVYGPLPTDMFDSVPLPNGATAKSFSIDISEEPSTARVQVICVTSYHCVGCTGACDLCHICMSTDCFSLGGFYAGDIDGGGVSGDSNGDGSQGGGGDGAGIGGGDTENLDPCSDPNSPWYTHHDCNDGNNTNTTVPPTTPCEKIKNLTTNSVFKASITTLQTKTGDSYESGFRINLPNAQLGQTELQSQILQNYPGSNTIQYQYDITKIKALVHSHYDGLYPIFSPGDIIEYNNMLMAARTWNENLNNYPKIDVSSLTFTVVTSQGTYTMAFDGFPMPLPIYGSVQLNALNKKYMEDYINKGITVANVSGTINYNMPVIEKEFLKFFNKELQFPAMKLYRVTPSGNVELKLVNGNITETQCP